MIHEEITGTLKTVFESVFDENNIAITRDMTAEDVASWDSLHHIQLISEVERTFKIKFKLREVMAMKNVGDLIDLIDRKTGS